MIRRVLDHFRIKLPWKKVADRRGQGTRRQREEFPAGHFYSPIPDIEQVLGQWDSLFRRSSESVATAIDLRSGAQKELLEKLAGLSSDFPYLGGSQDLRFSLGNGYFAIGDALVLYGIMRLLRPSRIIEIGAGFSSALMLDTAERHLDDSVKFTFIDPYPERLRVLLRPRDLDRVRILQRPVQDVPLEEFLGLSSGDIVFVDSSHVAKAGSDVNHVLFEVMPQLETGVYVHFHDVFWPFEYPAEWIQGGRAWNEAYLLRAFLMYNDAFDIEFFSSYVGWKFRDRLEQAMPAYLGNTGASLWVRRR